MFSLNMGMTSVSNSIKIHYLNVPCRLHISNIIYKPRSGLIIPLVPKKFLKFLPNIDMAAILVMIPGPCS